MNTGGSASVIWTGKAVLSGKVQVAPDTSRIGIPRNRITITRNKIVWSGYKVDGMMPTVSNSTVISVNFDSGWQSARFQCHSSNTWMFVNCTVYFMSYVYSFYQCGIGTTVWEVTHWGWVTHICVSNLTSIASDNGLSPGGRQAIIWTNAGTLLTGPSRTNFIEMRWKCRLWNGGHFVLASMC